MKCVPWSTQGLNHFISLLFGFLTLDLSFHILGALVGSISFIELFVIKVFHEDFRTIHNLPMLVFPHASFMIFLLCYA
jgi:hypothetical protein